MIIFSCSFTISYPFNSANLRNVKGRRFPVKKMGKKEKTWTYLDLLEMHNLCTIYLNENILCSKLIHVNE